VLLDTAGPAEVDARLRLAVGWLARTAGAGGAADPGVVRAGELTIDEGTYTCRLRGRPLDLTFKEFELLKHLAQHPGRVYTRAQLLQEVWGYDYYGGTRTVDVHVRRLRAKLGAEHEQLIGTVRHVGYKFVTPPLVALADEQQPAAVPDQPVR
jgi:DNA-binding response OmpR family regulator